MMKRRKEMHQQVLWCLLLLFLGTTSISTSNCSYVNDKQPYYYYRGRPMFLGSSSSSSMYNHRTSSVILPIYGNVYPRGFYYVAILVGDPPRPYFLDPDTGSDLTWLQCDAPCVRCTRGPHPLYKPSSDLVPSRDPLCAAVQPEFYKCESPDQCDYEVEYADGGSSLGVLCGYDQIPGPSHHPLDGVLGLGKGKVSIVSQLSDQGFTRNVVGHCLSGRGGGYIFFGDQVYDSSQLVYGRRFTGVENLHVIFDSGSSYTYFASQAYHILVSQLTRDLHRTSLKDAIDDDTLPVCWKGRRPFKSIRDARKYFKPLALSFGGGKYAAHFDIPPENYLIISNYNIIGDISMQDKMIIYDNEKTMIGWGYANCERMPKGKAVAL
ncbi:Aspartic proteinase Asp1 [Bienertia sinuspersici]